LPLRTWINGRVNRDGLTKFPTAKHCDAQAMSRNSASDGPVGFALATGVHAGAANAGTAVATSPAPDIETVATNTATLRPGPLVQIPREPIGWPRFFRPPRSNTSSTWKQRQGFGNSTSAPTGTAIAIAWRLRRSVEAADARTRFEASTTGAEVGPEFELRLGHYVADLGDQ